MRNTIEGIKHFFEKWDWKYDYTEKNENHAVFSSGVSMNNAIGNLRIFIVVHKNYYTVNTILNNVVEEKYYNQVSEYLHRANFGLNNGNFEFDFEDGEVRYKTYVNFDGVELSDSIIEDSILVPVFMFDKYGKNLLRLMLGDGDPKKLIEAAETDKAASETKKQSFTDLYFPIVPTLLECLFT